jgi:hypothetical protein
MNIESKRRLFTAAGVMALAAFIWSNSSNQKTERVDLSSKENVVESLAVKETPKNQEVKFEKADSKVKTTVTTSPAPAPYFLNSDNFKIYDDLLYKVVQSPEQKSQFNLSLLDNRSLEDAANYLKNPSQKPGKEEKIYHLKASGFLIKAITAHPLEFEVTAAVKEILNVDLTAAKSQLTPESYAILKENKAEIMYHAIAVSEEIQQSYVAGYDDSESQNLLKKVQDLHSSNLEVSKKMIAER